MRIVLFTDSLGLPRAQVDVANVWTEKLLNSIKTVDQGAIVYPIMIRLLSVQQIWEMRAEIGRLRPDIVIFQFGIVDCSRRVLSRKMFYFVSGLPNRLAKPIRAFLSKHHYSLTKRFCLRYQTPEQFDGHLRLLADWMEQRPRSYAFIGIAPAGEALKKAVYDIEHDIERYNAMLRSAIGEKGTFLYPYAGHSAEEIVLEEDGHHLNPNGAEIVHQCVFDYICGIIQNRAVLSQTQP